MPSFKKLDSSVARITKELEAREKAQDELIPLTREAIRGCSRAIKAVHSEDLETAASEMKKVEATIKEIKKRQEGFEGLTAQSYQEYCEAKLLMAVIDRKELPDYEELGVPYTTYLTGLCDLAGELRREMLESLKKDDKKAAEYYFDTANGIYKALLTLRFSNSLLPNFRKKQDVARHQLEQARSELLR